MSQILLALSVALATTTVVLVKNKDGRAVEGAYVTVALGDFSNTPLPDYKPQRTDSEGRVDLKGLDPQYKVLMIIASGQGETAKAVLEVEDNGKYPDEITLQLRPRDANR